MGPKTSKAARTVKRVSRGVKKLKRQVTKKVTAAAKAGKRVTKKKVVRRSETNLRKAAEAIGAALGKTVGTIEKAFK